MADSSMSGAGLPSGAQRERFEGPRERLLRDGPAGLSDSELLALFLGTGLPGEPVVAFADRLLASEGGLHGLLAAPGSRLLAINGLGEARVALLKAALELGERYLSQGLARDGLLDGPQSAIDYLRHRLNDRERETFACLFLDTRHRVVAYEELFHGTIDGASVYPREVVKAALRNNAAALVLAHNHPSGVAEPSAADVRITERLRDALRLIDVRVLDHVVVGRPEAVSMAARGLF